MGPLVRRLRERDGVSPRKRDGDDGRIAYKGRFDEDNFEVPIANSKAVTTREKARRMRTRPLRLDTNALNRGEFDRNARRTQVAGNSGCVPFTFGLWGSLGHRAPGQPRGTGRNGRLGTDVAIRGLLGVPGLSVCRLERKAVGRDGERYEWTRVAVAGDRGGR